MLKKHIIILFIILSTLALAAKGPVKIYTDSTTIECELLCASDSLLYIWTGLSEFNETQLKYVTALPYSEIEMINLSLPYSWKRGIGKIYPAAAAGGALVTMNSDFENKDNVAEFIGISFGYSLVFAVPGGALLSIASHIPKKVKHPTYEIFRQNTGKFRKRLKLDHKDSELIEKIIREIK